MDSFDIPNVCATRDHEIGWDGLDGLGGLESLGGDSSSGIFSSWFRVTRFDKTTLGIDIKMKCFSFFVKSFQFSSPIML